MSLDPVRGHLVSDDDDRHIHGVPSAHPLVKSKSVRPHISAPSPETHCRQ